MADCTELQATVARIALNLGTRPEIKNIDGIVKEIQKTLPRVDREQLVDSIVAFTTRGPRKVSELSKKLNRLKAQARRESKPLIKERLQNQIAKLEAQIKAEDFTRKPRPDPVITPEIEKLRLERDVLRQRINDEINALKPKSIFQHVIEPFNAARAIMTSMDLSATFRQGGFVVFGNPRRGLKNVPDMLRALKSDVNSYKINQDILHRPNAPLYKRAKLHISAIEHPSPLTKKEEAFMSRWVDKIPLVKASARAYTTFLNKLRVDTFDALASSLAKNGTPNQEEIEAIANFVNVATGRGNLGSFEKHAIALNTVFFAPKYAASRFQLLFGQPLYRGTAQTRKLIAREYAKYLTGIGTLYGIVTLAGGKIESDPRSSDFGKIKVGRTRIDPLSGLSQTAVLTSRLASGETKSTRTGKVSAIRGDDVKFGQMNAGDVLKNFIRYKMSPAAGTAYNVVTGERPDFEPVTIGGEIKNLTIPLSFREIGEAIEEQGVSKGTALGLLSIFGMGLQTY